jgi:hypothetical protein
MPKAKKKRKKPEPMRLYLWRPDTKCIMTKNLVEEYKVNIELIFVERENRAGMLENLGVRLFPALAYTEKTNGTERLKIIEGYKKIEKFMETQPLKPDIQVKRLRKARARLYPHVKRLYNRLSIILSEREIKKFSKFHKDMKEMKKTVSFYLSDGDLVL